MNWRLIVLVLGTVGALAFSWGEDWELRRVHARLRTRVLDALRIGSAYAFGVAGLAVGSQPGPPSLLLAPLGLTVLGLVILPTSWLLRVGGLEPVWEIRRTFEEAWQLRFHEEMPLSPSTIAALQKLRSHLDSLRTPETFEWIDLMVADIDDWIRGARWPLAQALRLIRRHEIDVELLGPEAPLAQRTPEDATFLWHLYCLYERMFDAGGAPRSVEMDLVFQEYADELDRFRRLDTLSFIDAVQASARAWLGAGPEAGPWPPGAAFDGIEPGWDTPSKALWPNVHVLWGAQLDEDDRRELAASLKKSVDSTE